MTQISWQYQVNNRAGGYIVTNTDWNDIAGDLRAFIDQTTGSGTTDNTPLPIGIDLVNDRVYISDPDSTTPEDGNHADTTLSVVGTTTLTGNTQQTGTFTVGVDDTGHDVIFYGAATGAYMHWDEDVDDLVLAGDARLGVGIVATGTARLSVHGGLRFTAVASAGDIYTGAGATGSDILGLCTAGSERMRIDAGGLVGIGIGPTGTAKLALHGGLRFTAAVAEGDIYTGIGATGSDLVGICTGGTERMTIASSGAVHVVGAFSKGSGSFDIAHPTKGGDWRLRHSFIEGPQADLIYRGTVTLSGGTAAIDLDDASNMTDGTWEALCRDPWAMVASSGNAVEWSLSGKTLTITSDTADAVCSWMVIGERQDDHMKGDDCPLCDDDGHFVTEYERLQETAESSQQWTEANKAEEAEEAA